MNYIHKYTTCIIQYLYIYIMISSAGMALPAYIGNDNFIILTLLMGIYYVLKKKTLFHLQKQYLLFIGCLFFSMLLVIIGSTLSLGTALSVTSIPLIIYTTYKIDPRNYLQRFVKLFFLYRFNQHYPLYNHTLVWIQLVFRDISTFIYLLL